MHLGALGMDCKNLGIGVSNGSNSPPGPSLPDNSKGEIFPVLLISNESSLYLKFSLVYIKKNFIFSGFVVLVIQEYN